jgi:hypothetical protein
MTGAAAAAAAAVKDLHAMPSKVAWPEPRPAPCSTVAVLCTAAAVGAVLLQLHPPETPCCTSTLALVLPQHSMYLCLLTRVMHTHVMWWGADSSLPISCTL